VVKAARPDLSRQDLRFDMVGPDWAINAGPLGSQVNVLAVQDDHATCTAFRSILCGAADATLRRSKMITFIEKPIPPANLLAAVARTPWSGCQRRGDSMAAQRPLIQTR